MRKYFQDLTGRAQRAVQDFFAQRRAKRNAEIEVAYENGFIEGVQQGVTEGMKLGFNLGAQYAAQCNPIQPPEALPPPTNDPTLPNTPRWQQFNDEAE